MNEKDVTSVNRLCVTRAIKNAKYLQQLVPHIIPKAEPADGFFDIIPLELLERIHTPEGQVALGEDPLLASLLRDVSFPPIAAALVAPLFNGTIFFVRVLFTIQSQNNAVIAVSPADMATAAAYATQAALPISRYVAQFGPNFIAVNPNIITSALTLPSTTYNDQQVKSLVNSIAANLPSNSCVVVLNPQGLLNTRANPLLVGGYHDMANVPYIFVNLFGQNLTIADQNNAYAQSLSHEIAEMVVDPRADGSNPEVCDPCSNCQPGFIPFLNYFNSAGNYVGSSQGLPPPFAFSFFISAIMIPGTQACPTAAPISSCAYSPAQLIDIEPSNVSFDRKALGDVDTRQLVITNVGVSNVTVTFPPSPPLNEATFHWDNSGDFVIAPGAQLTTLIDFAPKALGLSEQTLTIISNTPGSPLNIVLSGRGVPGDPE